MRCKSCEYSLWNLKARQCPECGAPFKPSEFEFKPNSVCYCCLHCEQTYYGTTATGHLNPEAFDCVRCGQPVHMDEMILRPTEGVDEQDTRADYNPWLERSREGRFRSWRRTVGRALVAPGRLMLSTPSEASTGQAWWFAIATSLGMMLAGLLLVVPLILILLFGARGGAGGTNPGIILASTGLGLLMFIVISFVSVIVVVGIWGAVAHGLLSITGHVEHGIGRTYQAMCYSSGANITSALVCCGGQYWGWIWWAVSAIIMIKEGQKTSGLRASFAVLAMPVLVVVGLMTLYGMMIGLAINQASNAQGAFSASGSGVFDTATVTELLLGTNESEGQFPDHGLQLASDATMHAMQLVPWSGGINSTAPLFPGSENIFLNFFTSTSPTQRNISAAAAASLPEDVIAHRAGDFVFSYHGVEPEIDDPELWIVVFAPIEPSPTNNTLPDTVVVGLLDGTTLEFPVEEMMLFRLDQQNIVRADNALPPMPDPTTITTIQPAIVNP
jgi:hypothetical protein